jgi:hypothetical protein
MPPIPEYSRKPIKALSAPAVEYSAVNEVTPPMMFAKANIVNEV